MSFAIVIPTLDEQSVLGPTLDAARRHLRCEEGDLLVVSDGGSRDATLTLAREAGAEIVEGRPGRGVQLSLGARHALERGATSLLFLHADTKLPEGARDLVLARLRSGAVGGGFLISFVPETRLLRLGARLVSMRTRLLRIPLGDQAQFASADAYRAAGGFPEWPLLEDVELLRRLKSVGRLAIVELPVATAARRFSTVGVVRAVAINWTIWGLYAIGVRPPTLARLYGRIR
ncbi:MAG TPA: TIGR04283 family arsenosugar biosynthesis glycosyltransferase [Thermoanaerobaculia bacterium]|nr:TIGR04283 family arsenosugar biosynthesis glycosyltransferase [Thermoanaerobaculia bacterium]